MAILFGESYMMAASTEIDLEVPKRISLSEQDPIPRVLFNTLRTCMACQARTDQD